MDQCISSMICVRIWGHKFWIWWRFLLAQSAPHFACCATEALYRRHKTASRFSRPSRRCAKQQATAIVNIISSGPVTHNHVYLCICWLHTWRKIEASLVLAAQSNSIRRRECSHSFLVHMTRVRTGFLRARESIHSFNPLTVWHSLRCNTLGWLPMVAISRLYTSRTHNAHRLRSRDASILYANLPICCSFAV